MNVIYILQNSYFLNTKNEQLKLGNKIILGEIWKKKFHYLQFFQRRLRHLSLCQGENHLVENISTRSGGIFLENI